MKMIQWTVEYNQEIFLKENEMLTELAGEIHCKRDVVLIKINQDSRSKQHHHLEIKYPSSMRFLNQYRAEEVQFLIPIF